MLRRSGFNRIFVVPKDVGGRPSAFWKPIWIDSNKATIEAQTATLPGLAGYIKGSRMNGIRVEAPSFATCWKVLKPDLPMPQLSKAQYVWKVQPFPWGLDKDILTEWLSKISWNASPLKPLGARAWLISSDDKPPPGILRFNQHPLLITETKSRSSTDTTGIVAGKPSTATTTADTSTTATNAFRLGDPMFDPWKASATAAASSSQQQQATGPTTQRLDHQEQRLDELEKTVRDFHSQAQKQSQEHTRRLDCLETTMQSHAQQTQQAFQTMRTDFESTLYQALQQTESRFAGSLSEIKQLLLRNDKRKHDDSDDDFDG